MDIKLKCSLQSWAFMEVTATRKKPMNNEFSSYYY